MLEDKRLNDKEEIAKGNFFRRIGVVCKSNHYNNKHKGPQQA